MEEAWAVLRLVAKTNNRPFPPNIQVDSVLINPKRSHLGHLQAVKVLFSAKYVRTTLCFWVMWFLSALGYFGVATWLPEYLQRSGISTTGVYQNFVWVGLGQLVGLIGTSLVVDRFGRKKTLCTLFFLTAAFTMIFAYSKGEAMVVTFAVLINVANNGASGVVYTVTPEAFPTKVRSTAMGLCSVFNKSAGMIAPVLGATLLEYTILSFIIWGGAYFIAAGLVLLLPRDTANSKMEEDYEEEKSEKQPLTSHDQL